MTKGDSRSIATPAVTRIAAIAIGIYFLYFAAGAVRAHFAPDDIVNLGRYYERGLPRVLFDTIAFWSDAYRPTGGLFYLLIYPLAGLNPLPYRLVLLAAIAGNVYLTWRIALRITGSQAGAALAAMLACGHAGMLAIYYDTALVYDILAYFFTALMLVLHIEGRGGVLSQLGVVLAYVAAIDAKEIAVVGAGWVVAYELLLARPRRWPAPFALLAIGLLYTAGKMLGPAALGHSGGYETQFTLHRFVVNSCVCLNDLFYSTFFRPGKRLEIAWALGTLACAIWRRREVWWGWFIVSTAALPVAFTLNPRNGPSLYLPLFAWSVLAAIVMTGIFTAPARQWIAAAVVAAIVSAYTIALWRDREQRVLDNQALTWSVITQVQEGMSRPGPGSHVIFLQDPFAGWDTYFVARLLWQDRSIDIQLADKLPEPPPVAELARFDWVLTFENGNLRVLRRPWNRPPVS